jgi:uncharacterized iron-regulated membrane protein
MKLRGRLLLWHRTIGLTIAALVLLSASTGVLLLFREQLGAVRPKVTAVAEPVTLERIVAAGVAAGDGSPATDIGLPGAPDQAYVVWLDDDDETEIYLDGAAQVVGRHAGQQGLTRMLFRLHTGELLGPLGMVLSLLTAAGLLALVGSGSYVALRRVGRRRRAPALVSTPDRRAG